MRGLLCVPQSSKERLRRSRTESSGAAPAIEELAGEARQVRPGGPHAEKLATGFGLLSGGEVWRATGPPAPASIKPLRKFSRRLNAPSGLRRSRNFPLRYYLRPSGEVWRVPGPPAPASIKLLRKFSISPTSRLRATEVGNFRFGTIFAHPGRSGGRPALQHPRALNPCGSSAYRLHPDCGPQKSEISVSVQSSLIRGGLEGARPSGARGHCASLFAQKCRQVAIQLTLRYSNYERNRQIKNDSCEIREKR